MTLFFMAKNEPYPEPFWYRAFVAGWGILMAALGLSLISMLVDFWWRRIHGM
jgi:hypothetical protein